MEIGSPRTISSLLAFVFSKMKLEEARTVSSLLAFVFLQNEVRGSTIRFFFACFRV